jgi:catechol 2,3-dioxygenase-like lactoylglutathione lyase family enzyme
MPVIEKVKIFSITVSDMKKSKAFYADTLGLKVGEEYREDDDNWWVPLEFPGGGTAITLGKAVKYGIDEALKPGMIGMYFETSDVEVAYKELGEKGVKVGEIQDDLFGPGSGTRFFTIEDPDGNSINVFQEA